MAKKKTLKKKLSKGVFYKVFVAACLLIVLLGFFASIDTPIISNTARSILGKEEAEKFEKENIKVDRVESESNEEQKQPPLENLVLESGNLPLIREVLGIFSAN